MRAGLGLVELLLALALLAFALLPVLGLISSTTGTTAMQDFRLLAQERGTALLELLATRDHALLRAAVTPSAGVDVNEHGMARGLLDAVDAAAVSAKGRTSLASQLKLYRQRVTIVPVGGDDALLSVSVEMKWDLPVSRTAGRLVLRTLVCRPDLSERR